MYRTMNIAAVSEMPSVTVSMHDVGGTEDITTKQRMMSSCTGAIFTSFFSMFSFYIFCHKLSYCSLEAQAKCEAQEPYFLLPTISMKFQLGVGSI